MKNTLFKIVIFFTIIFLTYFTFILFKVKKMIFLCEINKSKCILSIQYFGNLQLFAGLELELALFVHIYCTPQYCCISLYTAFIVHQSIVAFLCTQNLLYTTVLLHFSVHRIYCTPQYCCISLYTAFTVH